MRSASISTRLAALSLLAAAVLSVSSAARADAPLRWKFNAGDKFNCEMVQDMNMSAAAPSGEMKTTLHQQMDMVWEVKEVKEDGNAVVTQLVKRVQMKMTAPSGQGFEYDTDAEEPPTGMAAMFAPIYKAMMQGEIVTTMTPRGEVIDVTIPDEVITAMRNIPGAAAMGEMASTEGLKKMATQGSMVLPEAAPTSGTQWSSTVDIDNPMVGKMIVQTAYEYQGTKDVDGATCAVISPTVTMKIEGQAQVPVTVQDQTSDGQILFNADAGRLLSSKIKQGMTLGITVQGQTIQQQIDQTNSVKLTPAAE